jgi:HEAT repeat protein
MRRLTFLAAACVVAAAGAASADKAGSFLDKSRQDWMRELVDKDSAAKRRAAAFALGKIGAEDNPKAVVRALAGRLRDDDAGVRDVAASALGDVFTALGETAGAYWSDAGPALQKALKDADPRVRRSAACALGALGPDAVAARDALVAALDDDAAGVRQNAAWALGRLGQEAGAAAVDKLRGLLKDREPLVRRDAAGALGEIGNPLARPGAAALLDRLPQEKDGVVRRTALHALSFLAGPEDQASAGVLADILDDAAADEETRWDAAFVLASVGGKNAEKALPYLRKALQGSDTQLQEQAAAAVARLGLTGKPAIEDLGQILGTAKQAGARRNAAIALGLIGKQCQDARPPVSVPKELIDVVPRLAEALARRDDPDAEGNTQVRLQAAEALAFVGFPGNKAALPTLLDVIRDDSQPIVRQRCVWSLFNWPQLDPKTTAVLTAVLDETAEDDGLMVRYDAARLLAARLKERAPDKTADVLLHMLKNEHLFQFNNTEVKGGVGNEGGGGKTNVTVNQGGDARFMAAKSLGDLGKKANRADVLDALKAAAKSDDKRLSEEANKALTAIQK